MSLVVTGISHHGSDVALREQLMFSAESLPKALAQLRNRIEDAGVVILSTCNRSEIYVNHAGTATDLHRDIRRFLSDWHDLPEHEFQDAVYEHDGKETVRHLFRVTSSLDSLVVGESQIQGQVHDAYLQAHTEQTTDKVLNALFQKSFSIAKRVRSQSKIGVGKVSVSSVAVDLAASVFIDLSDKTVMVIGSGETGALTLKHLIERGVGKVIVVNRTLERAQELAEAYRGEAVSLAELEQHLARADIVISATGSQDFVLKKEHFQRALRERSKRPMFVIDIAVPRDVAPEVNEIDNVYVYDMDDLQEAADANLESRRNEVERCLEIVDTGADQFWKWYRALIAEPTIVSLTAELNAVRERELAKTLATLPDLSEKQREEVTYLTKRIVNNMIQRPLTQLKREVSEHEDHGSVLQLVRRLFGLKEST